MNKDLEALEQGLKFFKQLKGEQMINLDDLIEALDQRYGNPHAKDNVLIHQAISELRRLKLENEALREGSK